MSRQDDLTGLIANASSAIESLESSHVPARKPRKPAGPLLVLIPLLLVPVGLVALFNRQGLSDLSSAAVETQLIAILHSAQASLNAIVSLGKPLPPVLPNASLAGIVN